jgi:molecular chaperone GrpE
MSRRNPVNNRRMTEETIETTQNTDSGQDQATTADEAVPALPEFAPVSLEEFERLKAERDSLLDRLARLQAEFDNARKREARERNEFRDYATANAVEQFLPVLDNFQLALKSTGTAEQLRAGVELIVKQMEEALRSLNVQPIEAVGTEFDPRSHDALEMVEKPELPDHQVFEEVRRGYRIKDRMLRPALVRVASNPQQKEA